MARALRVSGWSGPSSRSRSAATRSSMAMASPVRPAARYEAARLARALRVSGWSGPSSRSRSAATRSSMAMASPVRPASRYEAARLPRAVRVSGWSGPSSRSRVGGDPLFDGDGLAGAPRLPVRGGQVAPGGEGVGVVGAEQPLACRRRPALRWRWPRRCAPPPGTRRPGWPGRSGCRGGRGRAAARGRRRPALRWRWPRRCAPPTGTRRPGWPGR